MNVLSTVTKAVEKLPCKDKILTVAHKVSSKSPEILLVGGAVAVVGGTILCCVKTKKVVDEYREKSDLIEVDDAITDEKEFDKALARAKFITGLKCARHYIVPTACVATGVTMMIAARNIEHRRFLLVSSAYDSLLTVYTTYRERVIADQGPEADASYTYGETDVTKVETYTTKGGKEKEKETVVKVLDHEGQSMLHRIFDEYNSRNAERSLIYNYDFLVMTENIVNQSLKSKGYVFLDEVYKLLGFDLEGYSKTKLIGWLYDKNREDEKQIDFGLASNNELYKNSFGGFDNNGIWLTFNVDGVIIDKI